MNFSIDSYHRQYLEGMMSLYNRETEFEPYIAPLNPVRFEKFVENKSYFDPSGLLIAIKEGQVIGWIHACVAAGSEGHHKPDNRIPRIRMLIYPRDHLKVGAALVTEATKWLKGSGKSMFLAMHAQVGYPFYRGLWFGCEPMCPTSLPHIHMALEVGGYKTTQESIFMTIEMDRQPEEINADMPLEFVESDAEMVHEPMRESWIGFKPLGTNAIIKHDMVGRISWVILPQVADRLGAPCMNIWGLNVLEKYRRKGIASALISHVMRRSYDMGAGFASVCTQLWNVPAQASYAKLGFKPRNMVTGRSLNINSGG